MSSLVVWEISFEGQNGREMVTYNVGVEEENVLLHFWRRLMFVCRPINMPIHALWFRRCSALSCCNLPTCSGGRRAAEGRTVHDVNIFALGLGDWRLSRVTGMMEIDVLVFR